ncbi:S49 family peptidase [Asaia siamensis]
MKRTHALDAIRTTPWAIQPQWLDAIEAIAERALLASSVEQLRQEEHGARYDAMLSAVADSGSRLPGSRNVTLSRGVALVPVMGPIMPYANLMADLCGFTTLDSLSADLRSCEASPDVSQVLLVVDSPGGMTTQLSEVANQIAALSKPVTSFVTGCAASAAYWLACQAGEIVMNDMAHVGSIGIVVTAAKQVQPDSSGRMPVYIVSSNAPHKRYDLADEADQARIRTMLDEMEAVFIAAVASGRSTTVENVQQNFGQGGEMAARSAVAAGMADRIDTLGNTIARLSTSPTSQQSAPRRNAAQQDLAQRRARTKGN